MTSVPIPAGMGDLSFFPGGSLLPDDRPARLAIDHDTEGLLV